MLQTDKPEFRKRREEKGITGGRTELKKRVHNLSSSPHITNFSAVVAKKQKNFEKIFFFELSEHMTTSKLLHKLLKQR